MLKIEIHGLESVRKQLQALSGTQFEAAAAKTLNMVAGRVAKEMKAEMGRVFDKPTRYTLQSVQWKPAKVGQLGIEIAPTYFGGKGIDPQQFLKAEAFGGRRNDKRAEVALRRVRILPNGMQMVIPKTPFPGSVDAYGNLKGSFIVHLISYFQAFGEQGYRANMTQRRKDKLADRSAYSSLYNKRQYTGARGVEYFVVNNSGQMAGVSDMAHRTGHLQPGIWAKSGRHGATGIHRLWPVVIFAKTGTYKPRLSMERILRQSQAQELFTKWLRGNIKDAARQAGAQT